MLNYVFQGVLNILIVTDIVIFDRHPIIFLFAVVNILLSFTNFIYFPGAWISVLIRVDSDFNVTLSVLFGGDGSKKPMIRCKYFAQPDFEPEYSFSNRSPEVLLMTGESAPIKVPRVFSYRRIGSIFVFCARIFPLRAWFFSLYFSRSVR